MTDNTPTPTDGDAPNEIVETAKAHARLAARAAADKAKNWPLGRIGLGVGIGSAAVAAAVLFARRHGD